MDQLSTYVCLDVRKDAIAVPVAEEGKRGEVREHVKLANTLSSSDEAGEQVGSWRTRPDVLL